MTSNKLFFASILVSIPLFFTNCKKAGCTDENAINYVFEANKDDGSCTYEGNIIFYYDYATATNLDTAGVDTLYFYIDSINLSKVHVLNNYSPLEPNCDQVNAIKFARLLGNKSSEAANWYVNDQFGTNWFSGTTNFTGGVCTLEELVYP